MCIRIEILFGYIKALSTDRIFVEVSVNLLCTLLYSPFVESVNVGLLVKVLFLLTGSLMCLFVILPEVTMFSRPELVLHSQS